MRQAPILWRPAAGKLAREIGLVAGGSMDTILANLPGFSEGDCVFLLAKPRYL